MTVEVGPPVDLGSWRGQELTGPVLRGATDAVMSEVRSMLERIRGEQAPTVVFDPENRESA